MNFNMSALLGLHKSKMNTVGESIGSLRILVMYSKIRKGEGEEQTAETSNALMPPCTVAALKFNVWIRYTAFLSFVPLSVQWRVCSMSSAVTRAHRARRPQ